MSHPQSVLSSPEDAVSVTAPVLAAVAERVKHATRIDVGHYKETTFRRQLERRIQQLGLPDATAYLVWLEHDPDEMARLQRSLLISVTRFFRDPAVFDHVRDVLVERVSAKADGEPLRIWVPGCATGEEAYSLAMLVAEVLGPRWGQVPVRIFATDIDDEALEVARQGVYPDEVLRDVPEALARQFLVRDDEGLRVAKALRDLCVFARHDLLSQPPFLHLDLVSCRNVLIYFQPQVQSVVLDRFHQALLPQACLMLGQSEAVGTLEQGFEPMQSGLKLYRRRGGGPGRGRGGAVSVGVPGRLPMVREPGSDAAQVLEARFHLALLARHVPPSVLVDGEGRVRQAWGDISAFLRLEGGRVDTDLSSLCVPAWRDDVHALWHLARAAQAGGSVSRLLGPGPGGASTLPRVRLIAESLPELPGSVLLTFVPRREEGAPSEDASTREGDELAVAQEQVHSLIRELDQARADQRLLDEELQVSSEELQSSNEELQASNEELTTLNEQLQLKTDELGSLNDLLLNIERSVQVAMVVVDRQLRVLRFNPLAVRIFGLLEHDIGRSLLGVPCHLPLDDLPRIVGSVIQCGEAVVDRVDQGSRHFVLQVSPLLDGRQEPGGAILTFTDVAELRLAEAERSRLAAIVTWSEDAIVGKTLEGIITSWNPGAERLFGYSADEAIGQPMLMVFPPEAHDEEARLLACIARGESVAPFDTVRIRKDGALGEGWVALSPIRDGGGKIVGVSKIARDISERKAIDALRQADQERHLQSILDGVPGMVAYWDRELRLRFANRDHRTLLPQSVEGAWMPEVLGAERFEQARPHVEAVLQGQPQRFEPREPEVPSVEPGRSYQINFVPDIAQGEVRGFVAMAFDVTSIRQAELAAEAASRAKSDFLAAMSHEIRTPLHAVLGLAQVAGRRYEGQPAAATFGQILEAGQHLLGLINDILDFSKIEAGKLALQIGRVEIDDLIDRSVGMVADQAARKGLQLQVFRDPALAAAYLGDPVRLAQLLINLLTNAVKFTEAGHVALALRLSDDGQLLMSVSDTGAGMSESVRARLFRPFEQGDGSLTRRVGGTGLGLSICKRLIELMNGRIRVDSQPGRGSCFEITLPLRAATAVSDSADGGEPVAPHVLRPVCLSASRGRLSGLRVLVAEDQPVNRMVLEQLLAQEGAEMVAVEHGGLAVEAVARERDRFDVVLCDIEMPEMDGYEATRRIKVLAPALPVIGLTAHAFDDARRRGQLVGMSDYITKPYMIDVLVAAILAQVPDRQRPPDEEASRLPAGVTAESVPTSPWRIDHDALVAYYGVSPDFIPRLLNTLRDTCEREPALLRDALARGDWSRVRQLAHGVAGMAANLLLPELRALANRIEYAVEVDTALVAPLVDGLIEAVVAVGAQLPPPSVG